MSNTWAECWSIQRLSFPLGSQFPYSPPDLQFCDTWALFMLPFFRLFFLPKLTFFGDIYHGNWPCQYSDTCQNASSPQPWIALKWEPSQEAVSCNFNTCWRIDSINHGAKILPKGNNKSLVVEICSATASAAEILLLILSHLPLIAAKKKCIILLAWKERSMR